VTAPAAEALNSLITREARLLDEWKLDDWLALYDSTAVYWVPVDEDSDPRIVPSIIYEDRSSLALRVEQLMRHKRIAQSPRSELLHQITNVELSVDGEQAAARYALVVHEVRAGDWRQPGLGQRRCHAGVCRMRFAKRNADWLVAEKRVVLLDRELPQEGLSYLL
jgi:ethylbenzene dioxygenase subunit beta